MLNGVKQGAIVSPVLFTICILILINLLAELNLTSCVGCHIDNYQYIGVLAYVDDITLIFPIV